MDIIEHKILNLLKDKEEDITINEIAENIRVDRHTAAKRLEMLKSQGLVEYRMVGKSKMWKISKSPFLNALRNNADISNNIKNMLQHMDGQVHIQDKNKILWSNTTKKNCCADGKECKDCAVEKTFRTGKTESLTRDWSKKKIRITTQPIKDSNDNTIAVIEIIKDAKKI
jgi:predicted transcriptional regulator